MYGNLEGKISDIDAIFHTQKSEFFGNEYGWMDVAQISAAFKI